MKKNIFWFLGLVFYTTNSAFSQIGEEVVNYSVLYDDPNASYVGGGLTYAMDMNEYNFTLAVLGFEGKFVHEKFSVETGANMHFGERAADVIYESPYAESVYEPEHSRGIYLTGTYFFMNDISKNDITITVKSRGNTDYVIQIPARISTRYGVDLGFNSGVTYYNFQRAEMDGIDLSGNTELLTSSNGIGSTISSYYKYNFVKIGASKAKIVNIKIKTESYGEKDASSMTRYYGQLFFGFGQSVDDIFVPQNIYDIINEDPEPYTQYDINTNMKYRKIGGCVGAEIVGFGGSSWVIGAELGVLPTPAYRLRSSYYLDIRLKWMLGTWI